MAGYCFSMTGLQYFFTDYVFTAINIPETADGPLPHSSLVIYSQFLFVALACPTAGSILARYLGTSIMSATSDGEITSQMLGVLSLFAFFTTCLIIPIPQLDDLTAIMTLLGFILILLGAIMPLLSTVFLCAVPPSHRVVACSLSNCIQLFLGHVPSTLLYGLASKTSQRATDAYYESRIPITVILYSTIFSTVLLLVSLVQSLKITGAPVPTTHTAKRAKLTALEQQYPLSSPYQRDQVHIARATKEPLLLYGSRDSSFAEPREETPS